MDLEGIVSKRIGSRYVSGRTRAWLKTKNPNFQRRWSAMVQMRNLIGSLPNSERILSRKRSCWTSGSLQLHCTCAPPEGSHGAMLSPMPLLEHGSVGEPLLAHRPTFNREQAIAELNAGYHGLLHPVSNGTALGAGWRRQGPERAMIQRASNARWPRRNPQHGGY